MSPSGLPPNVTGTVLAVGSFDGVHRGHRDVLDHLAARALATGLHSLLVTFEPHPLEIVNPTAAPPLLTVGEEKLEVLAESGIDYVAMLPFTPDLARFSAEEFVDVVLRDRFRMVELLMGYDHGFGRGRAGDVEMLRGLGARRGFRVEVVPPVTAADGRPISSTFIRRAVAGGDLRRAQEGLGRPYAIGGVVVRGASRGRALGFPTINIAMPSPRKLLPPEGVYAVRVQTPEGAFGGMTNLGPRPTFGDDVVTLEAHLFDVVRDWYGRRVRLDFVSRLRETRKFPSAEALVEQLHRDAVAARRALTLPGEPSNVERSRFGEVVRLDPRAGGCPDGYEVSRAASPARVSRPILLRDFDMSQLKYRLLAIAALILASAYALFPRDIKVRRQINGVFHDTTERRVPLKRGLDLQGGMYASLEVDESKGTVANKADAIDRALKVVRTRVDEFGVAEPLVQKAGNDRIIVELPGIDDPQRAEGILEKSAFLQFQITDKTQALDKVLPRLDGIVRDRKLIAAAGGAARAAPQTPAIANLFNQGDTSKKAKPDSTKNDTLQLATGGGLSALLAPGRIPGEYFVAREDVPTVQSILLSPDIQAALPPGKVLRWGSDSVQAGLRWLKPLYLLDARPIITGEYLTDAKPNQMPMEGTVVEFTLNNEGGRRFKSETGKHIGDYMAIVLDDKVMSAPVIQGAIGTRGQITMGGADLQAAQDLALVLRAGALPVPLKIADIRTIGASLGQDSIRRGEIAGSIAIGLVVLIMIGYYRFSGMLAVGGLMLYCLYTLAVLAGFDATLTLPGLAGFVLSVGIAVDANVLIFERIREELDRGKTVRTSIDEGFTHAMSAIVDSNVSTVLTASVLYQYGSGPVRGFAVTLIAGIAASMVTSIFVVKTFYLIWLNRTRGAQALSI